MSNDRNSTSAMRFARTWAIIFWSIVWLTGCDNQYMSTPPHAVLLTNTPAIKLTSTVSPIPPTPTLMIDWQAIRPGIEFLIVQQPVGNNTDWVTLARVDLRKTKLEVYYSQDEPRSIRDWYNAGSADLVINAGFFTPEKRATGLIIANGQIYGQSYRGFGGMFIVRGDRPSLQWLVRVPYIPDRNILNAVQSFPMLVDDAQVIDNVPDEGQRSRRSFIGIDTSSRVIVGVCHGPLWTLSELAHFLIEHPLLGLKGALNLDGGASSGLWIRDVSDPYLVDSLETVPSVIAVSAK